MTRANLSPRALRDIDNAVDDIAKSAAGPTYAERFAIAVAQTAERVMRRPLDGHRRLDLLPDRFRFRAVKGFPYLLVYNEEDPECRILRVVYMARDLGPMLADLGEPNGSQSVP